MKKANKAVASVVKKISETMANITYGSASVWGIYQPKEPKKIDKDSK
ncbi:MAG: cyclic lactone autoinducer peptide [Ruminococcus sp.]|nr:cyclic lactone autoinducer peptide [Ruminococcus sp.]